MADDTAKPFVARMRRTCPLSIRRFLKRNFIDPASFFKRLKPARLP